MRRTDKFGILVWKEAALVKLIMAADVYGLELATNNLENRCFRYARATQLCEKDKGENFHLYLFYLADAVGIAPTFQVLQTCANLSQLNVRFVN